jgi:hypothetical protein
MKITTKLLLALVAVGATAWILTAQDAGNQRPPGGKSQGGFRPPQFDPQGQNGPNDGPGPGPGGQGGHRHRPPPPIILALDANHDGVLDEAEIANASQALLTLDRNHDGKLTMDELMGPPPPRGGGPGMGPGPGQGQDGPGAANPQGGPRMRRGPRPPGDPDNLPPGQPDQAPQPPQDN